MVSRDCAVHEMEIRTYQKWCEHVSHDCAAYEMEIHTS